MSAKAVRYHVRPKVSTLKAMLEKSPPNLILTRKDVSSRKNVISTIAILYKANTIKYKVYLQ